MIFVAGALGFLMVVSNPEAKPTTVTNASLKQNISVRHVTNRLKNQFIIVLIVVSTCILFVQIAKKKYLLSLKCVLTVQHS
jgi:hypothetical protein